VEVLNDYVYYPDGSVEQHYKWRYCGNRHYELCNHLGNVQVVVTDKKIPHEGTDGRWAYYTADILSVHDYYAFGQDIEERSFERDNKYRYGFNGKEKNDDISSNDYDFGARIYDGRLGRWLTTDPLAAKFPQWSPYEAMHDNPIKHIDPDGMEVKDHIFRNTQGTVVGVVVAPGPDRFYTVRALPFQDQHGDHRGTGHEVAFNYQINGAVVNGYNSMTPQQKSNATPSQDQKNLNPTGNGYGLSKPSTIPGTQQTLRPPMGGGAGAAQDLINNTAPNGRNIRVFSFGTGDPGVVLHFGQNSPIPNLANAPTTLRNIPLATINSLNALTNSSTTFTLNQLQFNPLLSIPPVSGVRRTRTQAALTTFAGTVIEKSREQR
jgi:RHS repeat-associated protein